MNGLEIFATKLFELQLDQVDSFNLLNEILRKEDEIRIISSTRQRQSIDEYSTDYSSSKDSSSVKLENLENIFKLIESSFDQWNSSFKVINYWTAIYVKTGYHSLHNHNTDILDKCNYSGIIYLSDLGGTTFYSTSPSSFNTTCCFKSKMGKVLIFPSTLPHAVDPTFHEENKRYIISFNCEIRNK